MNDKDFEKIVNSTKKIVLSAIGKYLPVRFFYAIDDVAQETYFRSYKSLVRDQLRDKSTLNSWLYTIAKNESLRMAKKLIKEEEKIKKAIEKQKIENFHFIENKDVHEVEELKYLLEKLPLRYSFVLKLYSLGLSEKEIAQKLDIKIGTVKSRASRGRELMRKYKSIEMEPN